MLLIFLLLYLLQPHLYAALNTRQPPHIILIYADDLGWNDVSFHGSPQIPTPNIDALALNGVVLNSYYGEWICTPSRGALLTGKYPIRLGLQHFVILVGEQSALPLEEKTLPQHLKTLGYATHIIGKWHLGYYKYDYMPTKRGFDSFFGYLNGLISYYDYVSLGRTMLPNTPWYTGVDLYNGTTPVKDFRGVYATHAFSQRAEDIVSKHDTTQPLFLYMAHLAVHAAGRPQFHQAPPDITSKFKYIRDVDRRVHAGMMSALDDSVGSLFKALNSKGMLDNCIFLFVSDNGGEVNAAEGGQGSNYPLRGNKMTFWEGGVRLPALMWSPLISSDRPRVSKQLMHVTDWLPTLFRAAGGDPADLGKIDGVDMWESLVHDHPSPRHTLLHVLDPVFGLSAYRAGDLKVVNGTYLNEFSSWYGPSGFENLVPPLSMSEWVFKDGSPVKDILKDRGWWKVQNPDVMYRQARIECKIPPPKGAHKCDPAVKPCLFNITADPCEYQDLAEMHSEAVDEMMSVIRKYSDQAAQPQSKPSDPRADPMCHDFTFVPWMEPEHYSECDYAV